MAVVDAIRFAPSQWFRSAHVRVVFGDIGPDRSDIRCTHSTESTMDTMERDPTYIAEQVKFIRKWHGFTQENLANAAGLTTRTIEKIESGRHRPDEQTLRSIARAIKVDVKFFEKPTPEQQARQRAGDRTYDRDTFCQRLPKRL
jgi:DNA-binding XRE family transcriptional regulator